MKRSLNLLFLILIIGIFSLTGCTKKENNKINNSNNDDNNIKDSEVKVSNINVIINDKTYILRLENNKTVEEFINLLPRDYTMNELNGNEKYVYMDNSLSTNAYNPKTIEKGDVMLYGDNCLVIFYKSFNTSYSYTKIGHIDNLEDIGNGSIIVKFEK